LLVIGWCCDHWQHLPADGVIAVESGVVGAQRWRSGRRISSLFDVLTTVQIVAL